MLDIMMVSKQLAEKQSHISNSFIELFELLDEVTHLHQGIFTAYVCEHEEHAQSVNLICDCGEWWLLNDAEPHCDYAPATYAAYWGNVKNNAPLIRSIMAGFSEALATIIEQMKLELTEYDESISKLDLVNKAVKEILNDKRNS